MEVGSLQPNQRFNAVGFCLTGIRIWQWTSSFFVYASFSLLYAHISKNRLGETDRMKGVQVLGLVSLVYSTFITCFVHILKILGQRSWRIFAVVSVPGDLTVMGICLAKITILSFSGLPVDCHGLTKETYNGNDLIRQPADGYDTIRFGTWGVETSGELDELCTFPRTVYGLSVVAIFSYTLSILLSVLYLQQEEPSAVDSEKPGFSSRVRRRNSIDQIERAMVAHVHAPSILDQYLTAPSTPSSTATVDFRANDPSPSLPPATTTSDGGSYFPTAPSPPLWSNVSLATASSGQASSVGSYDQSPSTWSSPLNGGHIDTVTSNPESTVSESYGVLNPVPDYSGRPQRRWSVSTSSSRAASVRVATDDYFNGTELPAYSSRPGSLYQESMKYEAGLPLAGSRAS